MDPIVADCSVNRSIELNNYLVSIIKIAIKYVKENQVMLNIIKL